MRLIKALFGALLLLQAAAAWALDPNRHIPQYKHTRWTTDEGAPTAILDIAQDARGFLWLGTSVGLYRFDGITFEKIEVRGAARDPGAATDVLVTRSGDIWTWFRTARRFAVYRAGELHFVPTPPLVGTLGQLAEAPDGAIWVAMGQIGIPLVRYHQGRWERWGSERGLPRDSFYRFLFAADGALWISYTGSVVRLAPGAARFETIYRSAPHGAGMIAADRSGRIWLSTPGGTFPISGLGGRPEAAFAGVRYPTNPIERRRRMAFDRDGNLWIARLQSGVERIRAANPLGPATLAAGARAIEAYAAKDGLTSDAVNALFEDRDGNLWMGTTLGLDRFRPANVVAEPLLKTPAAYGDILFSASDGNVYVAQANTTYRIRPGGDPEPLVEHTTEPYAICEAPDATIWIAYTDRILGVGRRGGIQRLALPDGVETLLYACAFDRRGDFWLSAGSSGLFRRAGNGWQAMFASIAPTPFYPNALVTDRERNLILTWATDSVARLDSEGRPRILLAPGTRAGEIDSIYAVGDTLFAAGETGLARIRQGRTDFASYDRIPALSAMNGFVQTPRGESWALAQAGIVRIATRDLDRAFADSGFSPPALVLDSRDGLPDFYARQSRRSVVRGGDGRLWFATLAGTVWVDPGHLHRNPLPPGVAITSIDVDGRRARDPRMLRLPEGASDIEIRYAATSLAIPERVRFRYQLEGYDKAWIDPGQRRQAFYTNLAPGSYRFRVIAANEDGVWNRSGAAFDFEIPPTFLQSRWFLALCVGLAALLLWGLYRLRMAQVAGRIRARLEERLGERERIARELHDTLLQSVQGLILRFQSVANKMPADEPARNLLETALKRADDVIVDGRKHVRNLRIAEGSNDLRSIVENLVGTAGFDPPIPVRIVLEGKPRPVHPLISAEIGRIAGEALFNIARHAEANSVAVTISFGSQLLVVQIRDDGIGIAEEIVARGGKPGHYGLVGMRERVERIGGSFTIDSHPGKGTEVTVTLAARLAFSDETPRRWRLSSFFHFRNEASHV
ncbi:hypothetical protein IAG41_22525 [Sphingomonas sp. JC676]|uniref:sensor histidine kinase n=1 Tax=Sphingomonas sp. JC676 TaxID=2768065 RepID=UPI001657BC66|nr:sensor histidine kinase [Sphingomonas sp. JC676]MBC9035175.1 hypothetical protein [Sphingomonas sp. JC676]